MRKRNLSQKIMALLLCGGMLTGMFDVSFAEKCSITVKMSERIKK